MTFNYFFMKVRVKMIEIPVFNTSPWKDNDTEPFSKMFMILENALGAILDQTVIKAKGG
jgi:hypothetical protein